MWIFLDIVYFSPHNCYLLAVMWCFFVGRRNGVQSIHNRMGAVYIRLYDEPKVRIRACRKGVKDGTDIYEGKTD